jgi:hypothetical protein
MFRPDLLCGLSGFALGAAALLLGHAGTASTPPSPPVQTDLLQEIAATPAPHPHLRAG